MIKHSKEFKQEAVRIALTSGLSSEQVASDLGVGKSTLNKLGLALSSVGSGGSAAGRFGARE